MSTSSSPQHQFNPLLCHVAVASEPLAVTGKLDSKSNAPLLGKSATMNKASATRQPSTNVALATSLSSSVTGDSANNRQRASSAAKRQAKEESIMQLQQYYRTFVDEGNEDLVVIGNGEVLFSKFGLPFVGGEEKQKDRHSMPEACSTEADDGSGTPPTSMMSSPDSPFSPPGPDQLAEIVTRSKLIDATHLRTSRPVIFAARRTRTPGGQTIVAVSHDSIFVHLYKVSNGSSSLPFTVGNKSKEGDAGQSSQDVGANIDLAVTEPFAFVHCVPNTLTFGSRTAVIRSFYFIPLDIASGSNIVPYGGTTWGSGTGGTVPGAMASRRIGENIISIRDGGGVSNTGGGGSTTLPPSLQPFENSAFLLLITEECIDLVQIFTSAPYTTLLKRITTRTDFHVYHPQTKMLVSVNSSKPTILKPFFVEQHNVIRTLPQIKVDDGTELLSTPATTSQMHPPTFSALIQPLVLYRQVYIAQLNSRAELTLYRWAPQWPESNGEFQKRYVLKLTESGTHLSIQAIDSLVVIHSGFSGLTMVYDIRLATYSSAVNPTAIFNGTDFGDSITGSDVMTPSRNNSFADPVVSVSPSYTGTNPPTSSTASSNTGGWFSNIKGWFSGGSTTGGTAGSSNTLCNLEHPTILPLKLAMIPVALMPLEAKSRGFGGSENMTTSPGKGGGAILDSFRSVPSSEAPLDGTLSEFIIGERQNTLTAILNEQKNEKQQTISKASTLNPEDLSSCEFYNCANLPVMLNRATGEVLLVFVRPAMMAPAIRDKPMRLQFLLNRTGFGGNTIPRLLTQNIKHQESLNKVGALMDVISMAGHSAIHELKHPLPAPPVCKQLLMPFGYPTPLHPTGSVSITRHRDPQGNLTATPLNLQGNVRRIYEVFPDLDYQQRRGFLLSPGTGVHTISEAEALNQSFLTYDAAMKGFLGPYEEKKDVQEVSRGQSPGGGVDSPSGSPGRPVQSILADDQSHILRIPLCLDQRVMLRFVFVPLLDRLHRLQHPETPENNGTTETEDRPISPGVVSSNGGSSEGAQAFYFSTYLQHVFLDYARSVLRVGQRLSPSIQRIIIDMFLDDTVLASSMSHAQQRCLFHNSPESLKAQTTEGSSLVLRGQKKSPTPQDHDASDEKMIAAKKLNDEKNLANPLFYRLQQLLMYRAIDDHVMVAKQLIALSAKYPPAFQMGLDMLSRLSADSKIVEVFLERKMPLRAANFILNHCVLDAPLVAVLECAAAIDDVEIARSDPKKVLKQKDTGDRGTYCIVYQIVLRHLELHAKELIEARKMLSHEVLVPYTARYNAKREHRTQIN